jgi:flagellar biosynthesis GTPase FlhF
MSERWFPVREPRLRSEQTYLIPATDLTNRRLKRSIVAKSTPRRASPYPPVTKKKPTKMVTRSSPAKTICPTLIDNDSDMPGGLQLALIGPADPSGGAAGGLPPTLPSPFPPVDPLQTVKMDPPGAGALDPAGGAKRKTGNGNGRNGNGNGQKTQEEIEKERAAREAKLQKEQERAERMRLREEKAEQERLARIKQKEADNKEAQRLEKERQERDYRTQEELVKKQMEKERLAREQQVAEEAANALKTPKRTDSLKPPAKPLTPLVTVIETGKDQGKLVSVESVVTRPPSTNVVSGVYTSNYF